MHPAASIILFTTLSGAGYGLLGWLGVLAPLGVVPIDRVYGVGSLLLSLGFITAGLLASTLHLGHPERAWRAVSQWRSSWLSREGVCAFATYVPALAFALLWLLGETRGLWRICGFLSALGAIATIASTGMIYRTLKPIRQWSNGWVVPIYLALAAMTGLLWLIALVALDGRFPGQALLGAAACVVLGAAALKMLYWRWIDGHPSGSTTASATGLHPGEVRPLDPPHTEENYLLKEMGYRIGRKHAAKLRVIALIIGFATPLSALAAAFGSGAGSAGIGLCVIAALAAMTGVLIERWLFFAEAKHTVTLYYPAAG